MPFHSHSSFEIMYITAGSCTIFCGKEAFQAGPRHFVFIGAQVPHRLEISLEHPCSILNLEFHLSHEKGPVHLSQLLGQCGDFQEFWKKIPSYFFGGDMQNLGYSLKDLISHLQKSPESSDFLLCLLYSRAMAELSYSIIHGKENRGFYYLKKACAYIDQNIHETIRVPQLAAYTGINKSYLQSLFSEILGCSIIGGLVPAAYAIQSIALYLPWFPVCGNGDLFPPICCDECYDRSGYYTDGCLWSVVGGSFGNNERGVSPVNAKRRAKDKRKWL